MGEPGTEFRELLGEACAGSEVAFRQIVEVYADSIKVAVRSRLNRALRRHFDSDDFMQTMWKSFAARRDEMNRFESAQQFVAFLAKVASNKVVEQHRKRIGSKKFSIDREPAMTDLLQGKPIEAVAHTATPSQIVSAKESADRLLEHQPAHFREVLRLRSEGRRIREIADRTGLHERTVRRILQRLKERID